MQSQLSRVFSSQAVLTVKRLFTFSHSFEQHKQQNNNLIFYSDVVLVQNVQLTKVASFNVNCTVWSVGPCVSQLIPL